MLRTFTGITLLLAGFLGTQSLLSTAQDTRAPSIKEIMREANKPTGLFFELQRTLKDAAPDWAEAADSARQLTGLATALSKHKVTKGGEASWQNLTGSYLVHVRALEQAVQKKDRVGAQAAVGRIAPNLCNTCHKAHR